MIFEKQAIEGVYLIKPRVHKDIRGYFFESFRHSVFFKNLNKEFVQDNEAFSEHANVIRGLHLQIKKPQGKFITVLRGRIFDVVVDCRIKSKTFGNYFCAIVYMLSSE